MKRIVLCVILVLPVFFAACTHYRGLPADGVWYCEDLEMELSFSEGAPSFVIIEGTRTQCAFENDRGASDFTVAFLHEDYKCFDFTQIFFSGECDYWNDEIMVVTEWLDSEGRSKGEQYTFIRVDCVNPRKK